MTETACNEVLRRIGADSCGAVWAAPIRSKNTRAFKRGKAAPGRSLYNDYIMMKISSKSCEAVNPRSMCPTVTNTSWPTIQIGGMSKIQYSPMISDATFSLQTVFHLFLKRYEIRSPTCVARHPCERRSGHRNRIKTMWSAYILDEAAWTGGDQYSSASATSLCI